MARLARRRQAQGRTLNDSDTIAAVSSGQPPAAIAVIRISGPEAVAAATSLAGLLPAPRNAALRALRDHDGDLLDRALVLVFPGPASATGEDVVELHCHGGRAVVEAVERALHRLPGVRRADPGEFTRRALMNGCIDLSEAEGLADLLEAETEMQRRAALDAAEGRVGRAVRGWLDRLADLSARVEASIDYAEEGDLDTEAALMAGALADQRELAAEMARVLAVPSVDRWRDGIRVVVAGAPNAGKSTLINALASRDAAIVSPIAGTTRDRIEVPVRRDGVGYVLIDTAGLREDSEDPIERIGMGRARDALATADIIVWLGDGQPPHRAMIVHSMSDLPGREVCPKDAVAVSVFDPESVDRLWESIVRGLRGRLAARDVLSFPTRTREACSQCLSAINGISHDPILHAEQLRVGRNALASALGMDATDFMLDALFSRFCLGK